MHITNFFKHITINHYHIKFLLITWYDHPDVTISNLHPLIQFNLYPYVCPLTINNPHYAWITKLLDFYERNLTRVWWPSNRKQRLKTLRNIWPKENFENALALINCRFSKLNSHKDCMPIQLFSLPRHLIEILTQIYFNEVFWIKPNFWKF